MHDSPHTCRALLCTGLDEVTPEHFQAAILELQRGLSISQLAALEHALCRRFGVGSFEQLGQGPSLLQAVAATPDLQAALGDGAGSRAERSKVTSISTLPAAAPVDWYYPCPRSICRSAAEYSAASCWSLLLSHLPAECAYGPALVEPRMCVQMTLDY